MLSTADVLRVVSRGDRFMSVDFKDAFCQVPIMLHRRVLCVAVILRLLLFGFSQEAGNRPAARLVPSHFLIKVVNIFHFEKGPDTPVCASEPHLRVLKFRFIAAGESHAPNPLLAAHFRDKES